MKIAVTKETRHHEKRVSIVPEVAKRLIALGTKVVVETGAGESAGFSDEAYRTNGATIAYDKTHLYQEVNIVSWVKRPEQETDELRHIPSNAMIVAFFDPFKSTNHLQHFTQKAITTMALELLPHHKETEQMDAFSAMGKFAGKIALMNALKKVTSEKKAQKGSLTVLIIGSGNSGMAAAKKAHQESNQIIVVSTNAKYQSFIEEKLSGVFGLLPNDLIKQQERVQALISEYKPDIIITTARRYGQKSPQLITEAAIDAMKRGTVIEDLTANAGGNTPFTQADQEIKVKNNILICHQSNYPSQQASKASESYAQCLWHLLKHVITHTQTESNYDISTDPLLSKTIVTHQGKLCFTPHAVNV
jgi:NAD(P) transhydrogenase subunit alpha